MNIIIILDHRVNKNKTTRTERIPSTVEGAEAGAHRSIDTSGIGIEANPTTMKKADTILKFQKEARIKLKKTKTKTEINTKKLRVRNRREISRIAKNNRDTVMINLMTTEYLKRTRNRIIITWKRREKKVVQWVTMQMDEVEKTVTQ